MLSVLATAAIVLVVMYAGLGWWSHQPRFQPPGVDGDRLAPCPSSPNCVLSEPEADAGHAVEPLELPATDGWAAAAAAVRALGGEVERDTGEYLHATFTSRLFRFVDDLELRREGSRAQVRSASRVGYSDLGVNRKRVEKLRGALNPAGSR